MGLGFLLLLTAIVFYLCWRMAAPFLSALTWALAIALVAGPVHRWLELRIKNRNLAAFLSVILVTVTIIGPGVFLIDRAIREASEWTKRLQVFLGSNGWESALNAHPRLAQALTWINTNFDLSANLKSLASTVSAAAPKVIAASVQSIVLLFIMLFTLFYFFRDGRRIVSDLTRFLPLPKPEIDLLITGIADAIHATIYGRFAVATVQGTLGGLMFWILGLNAPILWGMAMMLLSLVPMLGAFIVWGPAALILIVQGSWIKALILTLWGSLVIGLIDNFLYPLLVGDRLQVHSLMVFFAAMGGIAAFGPEGLVLGPVVLAVTIALLRVWQSRISNE